MKIASVTIDRPPTMLGGPLPALPVTHTKAGGRGCGPQR